uniref:Bifunctional inhibitor/plant lipid transfer protein/seed storage helical domain-containing protein n=1 Tax=Hordeum vulgare subsp. vulgare TaxID=112509 RepID=A0A8I6XPJ6_HORVV
MRVVVVFYLLILVSVSLCPNHARASMSRAQIEKGEVMEHCKLNIRKGAHWPFDPSHACCQVVTHSLNLLAICNAFTAADLEQINLARWAAVTRSCGNELHQGDNCAGYIVHY